MFVDDGEGDEIVFVEEFGDFVIAGGFVSGDEGLGSEREERSILLGEYEFGEGDGAGEGAVGVYEINGPDGFHAAFEFAKNSDGVLYGRRDGECEELRGHAAGRSFFAVLEEFDDFLAGLGLHLDENLLGLILGEIGEKVGGGVGIHFLDDIGGALGIKRFDDGFLNLGVDLFESFCGDLFVESAEDGFAFVGGEVFDDVGDVGGVELGQALVRDLQLDAASGIGFDEIDESPGDGTQGNFIDKDMEGGTGRESAKEAANCATGADIDRSNPERGMRVSGFGNGIDLEFNVIDANDFAAIDIDDLLIEEIAVEEK